MRTDQLLSGAPRLEVLRIHHREFAEHGVLLSGQERRLAMLESLGATQLDQLTDGQVDEVMADCAVYFQRHPYRRWFDPLNGVIRASTDCGYYDGPHAASIWSSGPLTGGQTPAAGGGGRSGP